jgi:hypothetical protein
MGWIAVPMHLFSVTVEFKRVIRVTVGHGSWSSGVNRRRPSALSSRRATN